MELKVDLLKWIIGLILGQTALLLTVLPKLVHPVISASAQQEILSQALDTTPKV